MPKTAEEVARDIAKWFFQVDDPQQNDCASRIASALAAAKDEVWEEAAKYLIQRWVCPDPDGICEGCCPEGIAADSAKGLRAHKSTKQGDRG